MNDVYEIISIDPSESFQDVDKDLYNMAECIIELKKRVSELEDKMNLIESRSDLLQSSEERYYSSLGEDE